MKDPRQVDKFIKYMQKMYEDDAGKVKVTRGKKHKYLGMLLDYSKPGSVKFDMGDYVKKIIEEFPENIVSAARTPAGEHLFKVNNQTPKLSEKKAEESVYFYARGPGQTSKWPWHI